MIPGNYGPLAGQVTIGTMATRLPTLTCRGVLLANDDGASQQGNTDVIWLGFGSAVEVGNGYPLRPGMSLAIDLSELSGIYAVCESGGQTLSYMALGV